MTLPNLIRYFRDCFDEDNRKTSFWNIFHQSVTHRYFLEGAEELLTGFLLETAVDSDEGSGVKKAAQLYRKEKELVYCSLFIVGPLKTGEEEPRLACSPLLIHPAEIVERERFTYLRPDIDSRRLNYQLLDALEGDSGNGSLSRQVADLTAGPVSALQALELAELLEETVPGLVADSLRSYPKLVSQRELQASLSRIRDESSKQLLAIASSAMALINRSTETRGVVSELSEIAEDESYSEPLRILLSGATAESRGSVSQTRRVPAVLSNSQKAVIERGATCPLTLVIGPPGTGKSFTIAALAVEHLSRGQSVLVASKMNHAVDVVAAKIEGQLGIEGCVVRGGRKQYLKDLKHYLEQLLAGMLSADRDQEADAPAVERDLERVERQIERLEHQIHHRNLKEVSWGRVLSSPNNGLLQRLRQSWIDYRTRRSAPLWQLLEELESLLDRRIRKTVSLVQLLNRSRLDRSLHKHRKDFRTFLQAIRARTSSRQEDLFAQIDFQTLFTAFPVWLVNLSDIHEVLPLKRELFDLAIIDEATQCDIASCLPIFQRARRVVITGDPNQLRHLSFLPQSRQQELMTLHGLDAGSEHSPDYRGKSILDYADDVLSSQDEVVFLNEHFRSLPPIIQFSNERFYAGSLRIMTEKPGAEDQGALQLCPGAGRRAQDGVNKEEAERVLSDCLLQINSEEALTAASRHSIGVLSPFRSQVDYISELLEKSLPLAAFERHDILSGTAHTFQGEERDIVYLSLAVDSESHHAAFRFLEKPDVFNVAVTRARVAQRIYTSLEPDHLDRETLLSAYLRHVCEAPNKSSSSQGDRRKQSQADLDRFLGEVEAELNARGFRTRARYPMAGMLVDLVVSRDGESCGIDLVGFPGSYESAFPLERYEMFHRAGFRILPISYSLWRVGRERCLQEIERVVASSTTGVKPGNDR